MGKRKRRNLNRKAKEIIVFALIIVLFIIAEKTGILDKFEKEIVEAGIVDTSNVVKSKTNSNEEIITSVSEEIVIDIIF